MRTKKQSPQRSTPGARARRVDGPSLRSQGAAPRQPDMLPHDVVLALQRTVGNAAVARMLHRSTAPIGSSPPGTIQRLKETAGNRTEILALKSQYLKKFPKGFTKWTTMLGDAKSVEALRAAVNAAAPQTAVPVTEVQETETAEEGAPETLMTTDPYTRKAVGPFNGGSGPKGEVPGAKDTVFYDAGKRYCISRDRDEHAGAAYKLYKKTGTGWQRLDTISLDGVPMGRG